ncbi:MAG: NAD(P)/FAD-dependent oxidoreductase [Devosia sp.]|nr:NAD(P)/FAD-dependent oxidoreductase [Devosia sp.]
MPPVVQAFANQRIAELTRRARADLDMLSFATKQWVIPKQHNGRKMLDVVIIGAGQSGLVVGHALKRRGVTNVLLLDRNPAGYEGVWETYARNYEIRSPKDITGADLGIPSLSIQSFFEAKHGPDAWAGIKRVPRTDWMDYLRWYRSIADLPIENGVEVIDIAYDASGVTLTTKDGSAIRSRFVVLATGMDGGGAWAVPPSFSDNLPPERFNHSSDIIDAETLRGRRIGILGAGAAAFDIAVTALTHGASTVEIHMRRASLPMVDAAREMEHGGGLDHGHELSDATKWALSRFMSGLSQSPAEHHFLKAWSFPNFRMQLGSPWDEIGLDGDDVRVMTPKGEYRFDRVFAATGVSVDMSMRPELGKIAAKAALWRDRFVPPADDPSPRRLNFPYLDRCYRFTEREPGTAPGIERIYAFNALASMSMGGMSAVSISSHRFGVPRLATGITGALFAEQEDAVIPTLMAYRTPGIVLPPHVREALGLPPEADGQMASVG